MSVAWGPCRDERRCDLVSEWRRPSKVKGTLYLCWGPNIYVGVLERWHSYWKWKCCVSMQIHFLSSGWFRFGLRFRALASCFNDRLPHISAWILASSFKSEWSYENGPAISADTHSYLACSAFLGHAGAGYNNITITETSWGCVASKSTS